MTRLGKGRSPVKRIVGLVLLLALAGCGWKTSDEPAEPEVAPADSVAAESTSIDS